MTGRFEPADTLRIAPLIRCALLIFVLASSAMRLSFAQSGDDSIALSDEQLATIGFEFQDAVNSGDVEWAASLFDLEPLAHRMAEAVYTNAESQAQFVHGVTASDGLTNMVQQQINLLEASFGYAVYLRVHTIEDMRGPLIRYDLGEEGFNYILLVVEDRGDPGPKIVDLYIGSNGEMLSVSASAVVQLMVDPDPGLLETLFGLREVDTSLVERIRAMSAQARSGQYAEAYATIKSLPSEIQEHRLLAGIAAQMAGMISDEVYEAELGRLDALHGDDPRTAFLLIDYHFLRGDFEAAMQGVETLETIFGFDAAIAMLKSTIAAESGDLDAALYYARAGLKAEPYDENGHWALHHAYLAAKDFDNVVATLETLEMSFGYLFEPEGIADEPAYSDFARSAQFKVWAAGR